MGLVSCQTDFFAERELASFARDDGGKFSIEAN